MWRRGGNTNIRNAAEPPQRDSPSPKDQAGPGASSNRPPAGRGREAERRPPARNEGAGRAASPSGQEKPVAPPAAAEERPPAGEGSPSGEGGVEDDGWSTVPAKRGRRKGN